MEKRNHPITQPTLFAMDCIKHWAAHGTYFGEANNRGFTISPCTESIIDFASRQMVLFSYHPRELHFSSVSAKSNTALNACTLTFNFCT